MLAPMFMSPPDPTVTVKSVPSDSIFSAVAKVIPTPDGILTSAVAVRLILLPEMGVRILYFTLSLSRIYAYGFVRTNVFFLIFYAYYVHVVCIHTLSN